MRATPDFEHYGGEVDINDIYLSDWLMNGYLDDDDGKSLKPTSDTYSIKATDIHLWDDTICAEVWDYGDTEQTRIPAWFMSLETNEQLWLELDRAFMAHKEEYMKTIEKEMQA